MKKIILLVAFLSLYSCTQEKKQETTKLNIVVTYNNGDVDSFYNVNCIDSNIVLDNGNVYVNDFNHRYKTIASNVRKFVLIK